MSHAAHHVLEAHDLVFRFGGVLATNHVSLSVAPGEIHGLIGPNGAGKTTLIHLLAGTLRPAAGSLYLDGTDITSVPAHRRAAAGLSRSFQITTLFAGLTVLDNLLLAAQAESGNSFGFWRPANHDKLLLERARQLAKTCAIDSADLPRQAASLPHGEQRKLEFALALATRPRVLLLDEPMAGTSAEETRRLAELIQRLRGRCAMLLVEHDMDVVFRLADRISVLVGGEIIASDTPAVIRHDPAVAKAYLGDTDATLMAHHEESGGP